MLRPDPKHRRRTVRAGRLGAAIGALPVATTLADPNETLPRAHARRRRRGGRQRQGLPVDALAKQNPVTRPRRRRARARPARRGRQERARLRPTPRRPRARTSSEARTRASSSTRETGSEWDFTGAATAGALEGKQARARSSPSRTTGSTGRTTTPRRASTSSVRGKTERRSW